MIMNESIGTVAYTNQSGLSKMLMMRIILCQSEDTDDETVIREIIEESGYGEVINRTTPSSIKMIYSVGKSPNYFQNMYSLKGS